MAAVRGMGNGDPLQEAKGEGGGHVGRQESGAEVERRALRIMGVQRQCIIIIMQWQPWSNRHGSSNLDLVQNTAPAWVD